MEAHNPDYRFDISPNSMWIWVRNKSMSVPDAALDEMIKSPALCKMFSDYYVWFHIPEDEPLTRFYDAIADNPRLKEMIKVELESYSERFAKIAPEFQEVAAQVVLGTTSDQLEEFLDRQNNTKSARAEAAARMAGTQTGVHTALW